MLIRIQEFDVKSKFQYIYPWVGLNEGRLTYPYKRRLFPLKEKPAVQHFKKDKFLFHFFLFLWIIFALLDPDTADQN
jgi:hypothetical protein